MRKSLKVTAIVAGGVLVLGAAGAAGAALAEGGQSTAAAPLASPANKPRPAPTKTIIKPPASTSPSKNAAGSDCSQTGGCGPGSNNQSSHGSDPYQSNGFFNSTTLEQSVANEQMQALAAAPASQYYHRGPGYATVTVTCAYLRMDTYACSATDSDGDGGAGDEVQVAPDGNSWSDTGMHWTGPDIPAGTITTVDPVRNWTAGAAAGQPSPGATYKNGTPVSDCLHGTAQQLEARGCPM